MRIGGLWLALSLVLIAAPLAAQPRPRGAPPASEPLIVPLPPEAPGARCQAETIRAAFTRLGALETLPHVSSGIAEAAAAGGEALTSYCTDHGDDCQAAAQALTDKIGEKPVSCEG